MFCNPIRCSLTKILLFSLWEFSCKQFADKLRACIGWKYFHKHRLTFESSFEESWDVLQVSNWENVSNARSQLDFSSFLRACRCEHERNARRSFLWQFRQAQSAFSFADYQHLARKSNPIASDSFLHFAAHSKACPLASSRARKSVITRPADRHQEAENIESRTTRGDLEWHYPTSTYRYSKDYNVHVLK